MFQSIEGGFNFGQESSDIMMTQIGGLGTADGREIMTGAISEARKRGQKVIGPEWLLGA